MTQDVRSSRYVIISPMKDEARYVDNTLRSVTAQTLLPSLWIIADDGSQDRSPLIIEKYAKAHDWIRVWGTGRISKRDTNSAEISAFNAALQHIDVTNYDYIVKLDCDVRLSANYFETLIHRFQEDEKLGIASGMYLEETGDQWVPVAMPSYHAAGASKVLRTQCFQEIGGFVPFRGWDTVDEIRARIKGWKTGHFADLEFHHLKKEGSGMGYLRTSSIHGEIFYTTGGGALFFFLRFVHRVIHGRPYVLAPLAMLYGYVRAWVTGKKMLVGRDEAALYRQLLRRGIFERIRGLFAAPQLRGRRSKAEADRRS